MVRCLALDAKIYRPAKIFEEIDDFQTTNFQHLLELPINV